MRCAAKIETSTSFFLDDNLSESFEQKSFLAVATLLIASTSLEGYSPPLWGVKKTKKITTYENKPKKGIIEKQQLFTLVYRYLM